MQYPVSEILNLYIIHSCTDDGDGPAGSVVQAEAQNRCSWNRPLFDGESPLQASKKIILLSVTKKEK